MGKWLISKNRGHFKTLGKLDIIKNVITAVKNKVKDLGARVVEVEKKSAIS